MNINITGTDLTQFLNKSGVDCVIDGQRFLNEMYSYYNNMILYSGIWVLITIFFYFGLELYKSIKISRAKQGSDKDIIKCINQMVWIDLFQKLAILFLFIVSARMIQLALWIMG